MKRFQKDSAVIPLVRGSVAVAACASDWGVRIAVLELMTTEVTEADSQLHARTDEPNGGGKTCRRAFSHIFASNLVYFRPSRVLYGKRQRFAMRPADQTDPVACRTPYVVCQSEIHIAHTKTDKNPVSPPSKSADLVRAVPK